MTRPAVSASAGAVSLNARSRATLANVALLLAAAANALPILIFERLPLTDGPSHVYNASLLVRYASDPFGFVPAILRLNASIPPNLAAHGVMALLIGAHVSPLTAERFLLAGYAVLLPMSLKYALRGVSARTGGLEFLALPVVFNSHVHWGFFNFLLGLIGFLCAFGFWLRLRGRPPLLRSALVMTAVLTGVYVCHPVPLVEFWIAAAVLVGFDAARRSQSAVSDARVLATASVVPLGLFIHWALTRPPALVPDPQTAWPTFRYAGTLLMTLTPLATYTHVEHIVAACLAFIAVGGTVVVCNSGDGAKGRALIGAAIVAALVVFAAPSQGAGGTLITARLVYFPLFLVLAAMATVAWSAGWTICFVALGVSLSCAATVSRWSIYERYDARMHEFLQLAAKLPSVDRLHFGVVGEPTSMTLDDRGTPNVPAGAWGYVAAERAQWLASDYEPLLSYFPLVYRTPPARAIAAPPACGPVSLPAVQSSAAADDTGPIVIWMRADSAERRSCLRSAPGVWQEASGKEGVLMAWWPARSAP